MSERRHVDTGPDLLEGNATRDGTADYFKTTAISCPDYVHNLWHSTNQRTGLTSSKLGFGCYRTVSGNRAHIDSMREALLTGTNVIDTSSNYGDGLSEQMVGDVLKEIIRAKRIERQNVIVVTKAGYIQGRNLEMLKSNPPPDVVRYAPGLQHCIHPDFLKSQLQISRYRLGLGTIDFFLIHNPEYFLLDAQKKGVPSAKARHDYEDRLERAFHFLEQSAERGIISFYGVSSNTLTNSADEYAATHLDFLIKIGGPKFAAVQFPANILETDFLFNRKSSGGTVSTLCESSGLWSLANRPLNAMGENLVRLARLPDPPPDGGDGTIAEFLSMQGKLVELEARLKESFENRFEFAGRTPPFSEILEQYRDSFSTTDHLKAAIPGILNRFEGTMRSLQTLAENSDERMIFDRYVKTVNSLLYSWQKFVETLHHQKMEEVEKALSAYHALNGKPLAVQVVLFLLSGFSPSTVLLGMRRTAYVRQLTEVYKSSPPPQTESLAILTTAGDILD